MTKFRDSNVLCPVDTALALLFYFAASCATELVSLNRVRLYIFSLFWARGLGSSLLLLLGSENTDHWTPGSRKDLFSR